MKIIKLISIFLILSLSFLENVEGTNRKKEWKVRKSTHFNIYYKEAPNQYIDKVLKIAEDYYDTITNDLSFRRFDFWSWNKRCKIYLYPFKKEYQKVTGRPFWPGATADIKKREIRTFIFQKNFLEMALPHEMAHLIFREFVGYRTSLPLWLDEGAACFEEKISKERRLKLARRLIKRRKFLSLEELVNINSKNLILPEYFYAEAASVIDFLFKKYGKEKFIKFCRSLRDRENWLKAFKKKFMDSKVFLR